MKIKLEFDTSNFDTVVFLHWYYVFFTSIYLYMGEYLWTVIFIFCWRLFTSMIKWSNHRLEDSYIDLNRFKLGMFPRPEKITIGLKEFKTYVTSDENVENVEVIESMGDFARYVMRSNPTKYIQELIASDLDFFTKNFLIAKNGEVFSRVR